MKLLKIAILALLALSACSKGDDVRKTTPHTKVEPEFIELTEEYRQLAREHGYIFSQSVPIGLANLPGFVVGTCYMYPYPHKRDIDVDRKWWNSHYGIDRQFMVFHEMTHCYCNRDHTWGSKGQIPYQPISMARILDQLAIHITPMSTRGLYEDGCPFSIMYPSVLPRECYEAHYTEYVNEMFNGCDPI